MKTWLETLTQEERAEEKTRERLWGMIAGIIPRYRDSQTEVLHYQGFALDERWTSFIVRLSTSEKEYFFHFKIERERLLLLGLEKDLEGGWKDYKLEKKT